MLLWHDGRAWSLSHRGLQRTTVPAFRLAAGCFPTGGGLRICGKPYGHWLSADVGPNGRVLAQWLGACELPMHLLESFALGRWRGWAVVAFPVAACGRTHARPGVYVAQRFLHPLARADVAVLWR